MMLEVKLTPASLARVRLTPAMLLGQNLPLESCLLYCYRTEPDLLQYHAVLYYRVTMLLLLLLLLLLPR